MMWQITWRQFVPVIAQDHTSYEANLRIAHALRFAVRSGDASSACAGLFFIGGYTRNACADQSFTVRRVMRCNVEDVIRVCGTGANDPRFHGLDLATTARRGLNDRGCVPGEGEFRE
jgi:hypothetical protein